MLFDDPRIQIAGCAKCSAESSAPQSGIHAFRCRMHPRASPRQNASLIDDEDVVLGHHSEKSGAGSTRATTDARSNGFHLTPVFPSDSRGGRESDVTSGQSRTLSGWMSIFAPVSFAARRAFCPSLPIARDS